MKDLYEALDAVLEIIDKRSIPYALIGGVAVRAYAIPRNTNDIDITIALNADDLSPFLDDLQGCGFTVPEAYYRGWLDRVQGMPVIKARLYLSGRGIDVDIFLVESRLQKCLMARRVKAETEQREVWIATPEDLVLLKLLANRPRDRLDIEDILFISGQLDVGYLRKWAKETDVEAQLETALRDSGHV
jgi:hypothetical protein